ncbi:MAG: tRNA (adenosine(37)-N6)-dimethylallyltransferase MiaA [Deltaproteobacteria bacterium HGW-Deltaproteobacteria-22]|jgi:tRNA dimethylallyltransferase|nr:MAG: tRNA (adenosine(37)-N6)-dimethylallyltransferase MiaA [Deltaproteobacteria bacterium HGW-Deltaproteobacteria-22]
MASMPEDEKNWRILVLAGPTASGKTAAAIELAQRFDGEIVSADSVQVYRHLDIGSAKPTCAERALVPHHCIDLIEPDAAYSVGEYQRAALASIAGIRARGRFPIVAGGTGLYLRSLTHGLFEGPAADWVFRDRCNAEEDAAQGTLHTRLARVDPETAGRLHPNDRIRLIRALEVWEKTRIPLSEHHRKDASRAAPCESLIFVINPPREVLQARIRSRVREMLAAGFIEEVRDLLERYGSGVRSLSSVGYREVAACLRGELPPEQLEEAIVHAHEKYVKQQRTWFRDFPGQVLSAEDLPTAEIARWIGMIHE